MSRTMSFWSVVLLSIVVFNAGCAKQTQTISKAQIPLGFQVGQSTQYEFTSQLIKDFKFEQPALNKATEEQTRTDLTVRYEQKITEVAADGTATAAVTIKGIACKITNKNEARYEFDSRNEKFKSDSLNALIGQSYTMTLMADGKAAVKDAAAIRAVVVAGEGQRIAQRLFATDESIIERHQVALPVKDSSKTLVQLDYKEKEAGVQKENGMVFDITIKSLSCQRMDNNKTLYSFNSSDSKSKEDPLFGLVGKSYRIERKTNGDIHVLDVSNVRLSGLDGEPQRAIDDIFTDVAIIDRHKNLTVDNLNTEIPFWSVMLPSPPGMLAPKTFEKVYTLSDVKTGKGAKVAVVSMKAEETVASVPGADSASSMGMMAKMFENDNDYTGAIELDMTAGRLLDYHESLVSTYIAQEQQKNAPDKGPDTLMMRLTSSFQTRLIQ